MAASFTDGSDDVYVGGEFTTYDGTLVNRMVRLNSDSTIDSAFDIGAGPSSAVSELLPAADDSGDLFVGGPFRSYDTTVVDSLVRLANDGTVR